LNENRLLKTETRTQINTTERIGIKRTDRQITHLMTCFPDNLGKLAPERFN